MVQKKRTIKKTIVNGVEYIMNGHGCTAETGPEELKLDGATWVNVTSKKSCLYLDVYFEKRGVE